MSQRTKMLLFALFAPITVPAYVLILTGSNLLGAAFYIVVEASWAKLARRPITLSGTQMALLAAPVLLLAPVATAVHLLLAFLRGLIRGLAYIGRWQAGVERPVASTLLGLVWTIALLWASVACLNAATGSAAIGQGVSRQNTDLFVEYLVRPRTLGDINEQLRALDPSSSDESARRAALKGMQTRREQIIRELGELKEAASPEWQPLRRDLMDDTCRFRFLPFAVMRRIAGIPWYFFPAEISEDGLDHSKLMFGPLLFVWVLMIRWPGTFAVLRRRSLKVTWFVARTVGVLWAIHALIAWAPTTTYATFHFPDDGPSGVFRFFSPALWLGSNPLEWARPEWALFNVGLFLILIGLVAFIWWLAWRIGPFLGWPRYYVAFLASRLLQRKRIAFFSVGAVTLCVAMMIIVISVMGGFVDSIRDRANGLLGDLVVDGDLQGFPFYDAFITELGNLRDEKTGEPIVKQATPLIHAYGILQFPDSGKTKAVQVWGVRLDEYVRVNEFGNDLFYHNRFGGTRLDEPTGMPVFGLDASGRIALPGDMDANYRRYVAALPDDKRADEEKRYHRDEKGGYYPGPGVFAPSDAEDLKPGYVGKPLPGVIIGRDILMHRMASGEYRRNEKYPRGEPCFITVLPLTRTGDVSPEPPPKPLFRYIDDSRTGIHEIDNMNVYVDFDRLQTLLTMGPQERADGSGMTSPRCGQIQIKLAGDFSWPRGVLLKQKRIVWETWRKVASEVPADGIEIQMLNGVQIQTWEEMQKDFIAAIEKEKFLVLIMFGVISIVAVFLILCIFYMIVQEKTRDVGIIKSIGGSTEGVAAIFLVYGGAIGLVGCILGSLLGTTFVDNINEVQDLLARINPDWRVWSPETYSFDKIPSAWKWNEVLWISGLAIIASIAGAAFPALRAGRTWPVESLRYE